MDTVKRTKQVWRNMISRCTNANLPNYHHYGGRGIVVDRRWLSFDLFVKDMGYAPKGLQLDRKNNNKGYSKKNCRWIDAKTNSRNRRNAKYLTYNGKTQCLSAWAEETGINHRTIGARIKAGWDAELVLAPYNLQSKKAL